MVRCERDTKNAPMRGTNQLKENNLPMNSIYKSRFYDLWHGALAHLNSTSLNHLSKHWVNARVRKVHSPQPGNPIYN